MMYSK